MPIQRQSQKSDTTAVTVLSRAEAPMKPLRSRLVAVFTLFSMQRGLTTGPITLVGSLRCTCDRWTFDLWLTLELLLAAWAS